MARVNVKYPIGSKVCTKMCGIPGIVTAVFIRGRNRAYEFSYIDDGKPTSCTVEEVEIQTDDIRPLGFKK